MMIFFFLAFSRILFFKFLVETNSIMYSLSCISSLVSFPGFFCQPQTVACSILFFLFFLNFCIIHFGIFEMLGEVVKVQ